MVSFGYFLGVTKYTVNCELNEHYCVCGAIIARFAVKEYRPSVACNLNIKSVRKRLYR